MTKPTKGKIAYEPYLFAIAIVSIIAKTSISLAKQKPIFDVFMYVLLAIFIISSALYMFDRRGADKRKAVELNFKAGHVTDAKVTGADVKEKSDAKVSVVVKDIKNSEVTGYREN